MGFDKQDGHGVPWRAGRVSVPVSPRRENALSAMPVCDRYTTGRLTPPARLLAALPVLFVKTHQRAARRVRKLFFVRSLAALAAAPLTANCGNMD